MSTVSDLIAKGYGGYAGWGDTEAAADYKATGGSGKLTSGSSGGQSTGSSVGSSGGDFNSWLNQTTSAYKSAIQPALDALKAQIPTIQKGYSDLRTQKQADIAPLTQRYNDLINTIKNQGQTQVNKQTVVTAGELGKRGIEGSSTLAGQEIVNATQPIEQNTQSLTQQTGLSREADVKSIQDAIANLLNQENTDVGNINTAIAGQSATAGQNAVSQALQGYQQAQSQAQQQSQFQTAQEAANRQNEAANAIASAGKNEVVEIGGNKYLVNTTTGAKTYLGSTSSNTPNKVASYYAKPPGVTDVTGTSGNYKTTAGGTIKTGTQLPQATSWSQQ